MPDITPKLFLLQECDKDTNIAPKRLSKHEFKVQLERVFRGFSQEPKTMKQVSVSTRIDRANICWLCKDLRQTQRIAAYKKGICPITKHRATFWTTNPCLFPKGIQMELFPNG